MKKLIKYKLCFYLLSIYLISFPNIYSQTPVPVNIKISDTPPSNYGFFGNFSYNRYNTDIRRLPEIDDSIPRFSASSSAGFIIGGFYEFYISKKLSLMLRGIFDYNKGDVSSNIPGFVFDGTNNIPATINHKITSDISSIKFEPLIKFMVVGNLSLLGGFSAGIRLNTNFDYNEKIFDSNSLTFPNGTNVQSLTGNHSKPDLPFIASVIGAVCYEFPLDYRHSKILALEVLYSSGYAAIMKDLTWDVNSLRVGIALKFSTNPIEYVPVLQETPEIKDVIEPIKIVESTQPKKVIKIKIKGIKDNQEQNLDKIRIEEFRSTYIHPLLNYVFFEHNSWKLLERYNYIKPKESSDFSINKLNGNTVDIYHDFLNIIGSRMKANPDTKLSLIGCNSGIAEETGNTSLSRERAETISLYLENNWGINRKRISVKARNLPEIPSNKNEEDGAQENRRVEIQSDSWKILEPVQISNTSTEINIDKIRAYIKIDDNIKAATWKFTFTIGSEQIKSFSGEGEPPEEIDWNIANELQNISTITGNIIYTLEIYNEKNELIDSTRSIIPVERITLNKKQLSSSNDKIIDHYSLILFNYNERSLNDANSRILQYVNSRLGKNSKVKVEGFTDRLGDESYNLELSKDRAKSVANKLNAKNIIYDGFGESKLLYDNNLPEGRFYCRTVKIIVETPVITK